MSSVMKPQSYEQLPESTPESTTDQQAIPNVPEHFQAPGPEQAANIALEQGAPTAPPPAGPIQDTGTQAAQQTTTLGTDPAATSMANNGMPLIADDTDLIEKEWVDKAKQIVAQTNHDPYLQNKEINKVKADYLKKRYNKDLKLVDE